MDELERIRMRKIREFAERARGIGNASSPTSPIIVRDDDFNEVTHRYPLVVVDCWAAWCYPCRLVAPIIDELAKQYAGKIVFAKLNVDENPNTAWNFGIQSIPTLLIMKNGKEADRIVGALPKQQIERTIQSYL